ncbi:MAG: hypothetical protein H6577_22490 [Lewinellaceae bacterium]|nr:hypothetical protein [Lewinellaceae bacterium]
MSKSIRKQIPVYLLFVILGIALFPACKKREIVRAKEIPEAVKNYVYAYTTGVISKNDPVRVRFAGAAVAPDKVGTEADDDILSFTPSISGTYIWEDDHTVRFDPKNGWKSGQDYVAKVNLTEVFNNLPKEADGFEFDFLVREQGLSVDVYGIEAEDASDLKKQQLKGAVITNDAVAAEEIEKVLTVKQNGNELPISWDHSQDGLNHSFTATGIARVNQPGEVLVAWNGKSIEVDSKEEQKVTIPALGDFMVMSAKVSEKENQSVVLYFSDPLLSSQDLNGLIAIRSGGQLAEGEYYDSDEEAQNVPLNFSIDGNRILVFPRKRLAGLQTIEVRPGIRNLNDARMEKPAIWQINFEQVKPKVRLVGRGVILPASDKGLVLPFEAISLEAVEVEIFKIYDNNILQFLQTNDLDGQNTYDLQRVGRVVRREMVPLKGLNPNANASAWTRYALDLSKLFTADPNAIYQVRIGFRPEYAVYQCSTRKKTDNLKEVSQQSYLDEDGEIRSMWGDYYGIEGYYEDFQWSHRTNPCFPAYYNSENFAMTNVLASDLGITAKSGKDGSMIVVVASLRNTDPVGEAELEFYDFQQQLLTTAKTDGDGMAELKLDKKPFLIIAKKDKQKGYLKTADGNALSLSRFDVSGTVSQKGLKGYIYGERGVWRPGDSLYLNFILEDKEKTLPKNYPIAFELTDSRGQLQYKTVSTNNIENLYALPVGTSTDAPTGNWIATVKAGGATFTKTIKVETVKPNRLKIDLDFGKKELSASDEPVTGNIQVNWLHGAAGQNLKTVVEATINQVKTAFKNYNNYEFDDPARSLYAEPVVIFDGTTNKDGKANFTTTLVQNNRSAPGKLKVGLRARAFEKGGDFSTWNTSIDYSPYPVYAGIAIPQNQYGEKRLDIGKDSKIRVAAIGENGKPLGNHNLSIGLYRVEWRWWWDRNDDYVAQYNSTNHFNAISSEGVRTANDGTATWDVKVDDWGRYLVRVCDTESGHCSGDFFYAGYPWYGDDGGIAGRQEAAMMTFTASKEKYKVGEDIEITVPAGEDGRVFISLENGNRVIDSFWKKAKKGENKFEFEATDDMSPTVYAHVSLIQPHNKSDNDLPIRMYGVLPVDVENPETILKPVLKMDDELKPEQEFTVEVSEENNENMAYTLAVVDEGLLGLTNFKTPDPHGALYAREALGVKTWDLYDYVLGAYGGELERILSIGGDGEINAPMERKNANRFKPVVLHEGPFYLSGGKKKHTFKMPNYVGSVRVMVVAANKDAAYGSSEKTVPVKKPLMALATLPRVLGPGETLRMPVSIFAMESKVKNVDVQLAETTGLVKISGGATKQMNFPQPGEDQAYFDLNVGDQTGIAKFKVTARGGGETATQDIEIDVRNPNPFVTNVYAGLIQGAGEWSQDFKPVGVAGTNTGFLEVSSIPPLKLNERLHYLITYPHGCIEQTTSSAFPQLYVDKLTKLDESQKKEVAENVSAAIDKLKNFQMGSGAFTYWPGNDYDSWGTNYAGHFLLEAKNAGYTVPQGMIDRFVSFQKGQAKRWNPSTRGDVHSPTELDQAYRLYTLALAREPEMSAMNRMRELKNLSPESRWRLAAAYALAGKEDIGKQISQNVPVNINPYDYWGETYGSSLRDEAMILETQVLLGEMEAAAANLLHIAESLSQDSWYSTQTTAYALLAIGKFAGKSKVGDDFRFSFNLGNSKWVDAGNTTPVMQIEVPVEKGIRSVAVKNSGGSPLYARLILNGQPLAGTETAASNNILIEVSYKTTTGEKLDPARLPQGTDFIAEVLVTHPGTRAMNFEEMALTQIFPSGWEIINARLSNFPEFSNTTVPKYQDIRDDRVYTYFDIRRGDRQLYRIRLNAAYQGRYYLPAASCEAMYDHSINARRPGQWVEVMSGDKAL